MTAHRSPVKAAAAERGRRTLVQGLALDVAVAVAVALLAWLPAADVTSAAAWLILGAAVVKSILTAAASYVMRLKVAPVEEQTTPLPAGTRVRRTTTLEGGNIDGRLVATIVVAGLIVWLVITVLELLLAR